MKWTPLVAISLVAAVATVVLVDTARAQAVGGQHKYLVARLPASTVADIEFDASGRAKPLKQTMLTPLDSLGRDGWELVAVVSEGSGAYICFFKQKR